MSNESFSNTELVFDRVDRSAWLRQIVQAVGRRLLVLAVIGGLLSLLGELSHLAFYFDLLTHFRVQYVFGLSLAVLLATMMKRPRVMLLLLGCLMVHLHEIAMPHLTARPLAEVVAQQGQPTVRVVTSNLLYRSQDAADYIDWLLQINPDIIVLQEYTGFWDNALSISLRDWPYRVRHPLNNPFGIALYSRYPIEDSSLVSLSERSRPTIQASLRLAAEQPPVTVFATHPMIPTTALLYDKRNEQLRALAGQVARQTGPVVVAGDFNTSPWSSAFKTLVREAGLHDTRHRVGLLQTFPSEKWLVRIPIDFVLVNDAWQTVYAGVGPPTGSDHRSLWADIRLSGPPD